MSSVNRRRGLLFGIAGILVLVPDSLFLRLIDADIVTIVAVRGFLCAIAIVILWLLFGSGSIPRGAAAWGAAGYALTFAVGTYAFVAAIKYTHVANTLVIVTAAPLAAAALSALFLKDRLPWFTWAAAAAAFGTTVLVFTALDPGGFAYSNRGNLLAVLNMLMMAIGLIILRCFAEADLVLGVAAGAAAIAVVMLPGADFSQLDARNWALLFGNGFVIQGLAFWLLAAAARCIPAPEMSLLFLVELALAPLLVWLFVNEVPEPQVIIAAITMFAIFSAHTWAVTRKGRTPDG